MELINIKGIGPKLVLKLNQLGIETVEQLINYFPYDYNIYQIADLNLVGNDEVTVRGIIQTEPRVFYLKSNLNKLSFKALVNNLLIDVTIFNRAFLKNNLHVKTEVNLHGRYDKLKNTFTASNIFSGQINDILIEPKYHLIKGVSNKELNKCVKAVLSEYQFPKSNLPKALSVKYNFLPENIAVKFIHQPMSINEIKKAKLRLIYEELFNFMFKINLLKRENQQTIDYIKRNIDYELINKFTNELPFNLTPNQETAVKDIYQDLTGNKRMNRLLLGDVGSGKTIVSFIGLYINYLSGYQGAMMVPTEVLANQQYLELKRYLKDINCALLTSTTSAKERKQIITDLATGKIDIIIGTHALLNKDLSFNNLGLVITDEQHRFGVNQRGILQNKGHKCDILYLSATPIPRTYALTIYGDMDTSLIKSKIAGRKPIITKVIKEKELKEVLTKIYEEVNLNHQVFIVAPLIEENETSNLKDIEQLQKKFQMAFNHKYEIGILHGKMKSQEKEKIMHSFQANQMPILISTTVIEVGIDIKAATMMVIFNAERFGLATLHQLRGRVGRNDNQAYCYLICNQQIERLKVMEESNDGFYISEKDFELRGQGDLFGIKQSGDMNFKLANLKRDYKILLHAKTDSEEFIKANISDNFHDYPEYKAILDKMTIY